jgi:hypothetical protein
MRAARPVRPFIELGLILTLSSLGQVQKYAGLLGVAVYIVIVGLALGLLRRTGLAWMLGRVTEKQALWLAAATLAALGLIFLVVYPIADSGLVGGGSDRDHQLNIAAGDLAQGHYPYRGKTYLGYPISPLPGALVLAVPFVLLGNSAYQILPWVAGFVALARWRLADGRLALLLLWMIVALAPAFMLDFVTGGDLTANSLYVLLFMLLSAEAVVRPEAGAWKTAALAVLFGFGLASRANFLLLLPLFFAYLARHSGWRAAATYTALAVATFAAVTLPFYLYDPQGFTPLQAQNKFVEFEGLLPGSRLALPVLTGLVALALALRPMADWAALLRAAAIVQAFPVLVGMALTDLQAGALLFVFEVRGWGLFFLYFGALAAWQEATRERVGSPTPG